jgi:hypothetical protein
LEQEKEEIKIKEMKKKTLWMILRKEIVRKRKW